MRYNSGLISNFIISNLLIMKNFCLSISLLLLSLSATAQIINFPDANFKAKLLLATINSEVASDVNGNYIVIDTNGNNEIEVSEAESVYRLSVGGAGISSLTGIEYFSNLRGIGCYGNNIASLPLSTLVNIEYISCGNNILTSLAGIENLSNLKDIDISGNPLTSANFQNSHQLWRVWANNTTLTEINLCGTAVRLLWCMDSPNLQALYLKNNVVSSDLARSSSQIPPPLHNFEFYNSPLINYICYDDGEYDAVFHGVGQNTTGITLTTSCNANCSTLSDDNQQLNNSITLYPNPTSGIINIDVSDGQPITKTTITNLVGQTVMSFENSTTLDISMMTKGTYFITIETDRGKEIQKIIKL